MQKIVLFFWGLGLALGAAAAIIPAPKQVTLSNVFKEETPLVLSFPVHKNGLYRVRFAAFVPGEPELTAILTFKEGGNKDLSQTERALGFAISERILRFKADGRTRYEIVAMAGRNQTNAVKGELHITSPVSLRKVKFTQLSVEEDPRIVSNAETSGITDGKPDPRVKYAANLAPNPSFEEIENGFPKYWKKSKAGNSSLSPDSWGGNVALCFPSGSEAEWECTPIAIDPAKPVALVYRTKFSMHARPFGQLDPVRVIFGKMSNGTFKPIGSRKRMQFPFGDFDVKSGYGSYVTVAVPWQMAPKGATHLKLQIAVQEYMKHGIGDLYAHWGDLYVDDLLLWQPQGPAVSFECGVNRRSPMLVQGNMIRPPFLPAGKKRAFSAIVSQIRDDTSNIIYKNSGKLPVLKLAIGNLLGVTRKLKLKGDITSQDGVKAGSLEKDFEILPYEIRKFSFALSKDLPFGAYTLNAVITDNGIKACAGSIRFAWMDHPVSVSDKERMNDLYMFDLHPASFNGGWPFDDPPAAEWEAKTMRLLGVRGVRLGNHLRWIDYKSVEKTRAVARQRAAIGRKYAIALLKKHGLDYYITFAEQGSHNFPKMPKNKAEEDVLAAFFETYAKEAKKDGVRFIIFGNEAIGGHTTCIAPDKLLFPYSSFCGSTLDWIRCYNAAWRGAKKGAPDLPFGPGQAADENAQVPSQLIKLNGKLPESDCWAFNAYGNTPTMACNMAKVVAKGSPAPRFGVIPERGFVSPVRGPRRLPGEKDHAAEVVRTYLDTRARAPWIRHLTWFIFDGANIGTSELSHGLYDAGGPRPQAVAYAQMTETLGAGKIIRSERFADGLFLVWERINGKRIAVGWSIKGRRILLEGEKTEMILSDLYGNRIRHIKAGEPVELSLNAQPVYLTGAREYQLSRRIELSLQDVTITPDSPKLAVSIRYNGKTPATLRLSVKSHPLVRLKLPQKLVKIAPGAKITLYASIRFYSRDLRKENTIGVTALLNDKIPFTATINSLFSGIPAVKDDFDPVRDSKAWLRAPRFPADRSKQTLILGKAKWNGPDELSANISYLWNRKAIFCRVEVCDDRFVAEQEPNMMFLQDSLEMGFFLNGKDYQFLAGQSKKGPALYSCRPYIGPAKGNVCVLPSGIGGGRIYYVTIPWTEFNGYIPTPGKRITLGIIIDDSDGNAGDRKFIHWFGLGIHRRDPRLFTELNLCPFEQTEKKGSK